MGKDGLITVPANRDGFAKLVWSTRTLEINFGKPSQKKHDAHSGIAFYKHIQSKKHNDPICNKTEIKTFLSKGNILFQLHKGAENQTEYECKQNRELIKKLIITAYFLVKNNMAVKQSFKKFVKFIALDFEEKLFSMYLSNSSKNVTYCTSNSVEEYLKVLGEFLDENLIKDILAMGDVTVLKDESIDDANRSQMLLFVRYVDARTNFPVEKFMEMVKLTTSKKAIDLFETLINVFSAKGIDSSKVIRFSGLDGTNAMSG